VRSTSVHSKFFNLESVLAQVSSLLKNFGKAYSTTVFPVISLTHRMGCFKLFPLFCD
jgi:hypothetical protein